MEIYACMLWPGAKTIYYKKNTNLTQNKSQTHCAIQYEVTSFLSTDCELSTETCSLGPRFNQKNGQLDTFFLVFWWWFAVVCGGLPALSLVPIGILSSQILVVICDDVWWFVVVCGSLWWFVMVCGGLSFSHTHFREYFYLRIFSVRPYLYFYS